MDLDPVYSFNNDGLWLAFREAAKEEFVGGAQQMVRQIAPWEELSAKVAEERYLIN